jgi:hypothetical protein
MCTQYLHHICLPIPFLHLLPSPTGTNSPMQDLVYPPALWFCKQQQQKNDIFAFLR